MPFGQAWEENAMEDDLKWLDHRMDFMTINSGCQVPSSFSDDESDRHPSVSTPSEARHYTSQFAKKFFKELKTDKENDMNLDIPELELAERPTLATNYVEPAYHPLRQRNANHITMLDQREQAINTTGKPHQLAKSQKSDDEITPDQQEYKQAWNFQQMDKAHFLDKFTSSSPFQEATQKFALEGPADQIALKIPTCVPQF